MIAESKSKKALANIALCLSSALFVTPFFWLLLTALKPIEQTMKFQFWPKSYQAPVNGSVVEVIKEREITEDHAIVIIKEGQKKDARLLISRKEIKDGQLAVEEQTADIVTTVARPVEIELEVPKGWWRVREKLLRKYAGQQPRWTCVSPDKIEESVRFWWENFTLAIEYLSDTDMQPLSFRPIQNKVQAGFLLITAEDQTIDLARYDTLRLRARPGEAMKLSLHVVASNGSMFVMKDVIDLKPGVQDISVRIDEELRRSKHTGSCQLTNLWIRGEAVEIPDVEISEAQLILHRATFWTYLANTLTVCLLGCLGTVISSSIVAYGFSRIQWTGRDKIFWVVLATMMIPFPVTMIPMFGVFRTLGWINTLKPLWVPAFFASAFNVFLLRQFFLTIPHDLSDAARIDGCSELGIFCRIILPLSKPALAVVALFHFLYAWNDFMGPLIYLTKPDTFTLSLALQQYQSRHGGSEWHLLMAMSALILMPILVLFFFTQKTFIQGISTTGMKG
ncbi:MAG: carbohydrate ABC transporter permease [Planctomycetota bacterium]|nr:carbohydrate ABC transporter permease [Planctomycetota bacterium]MDA1138280.1 carbohydrate ABC transporter permease [Planctomycetota bacterium]